MTSFQDAPGLKLGFWSASKTLISFLGKLMLMKDQVRILSAKVLNLSTKLLLSGGIGTVKLGVNSVEKKNHECKGNWSYLSYLCVWNMNL